ncbi:MAG: hypothetical protein QMB52_12825 [Propionivibrio sp.]
MLALKLLLVPGFLILITLAGKRWGPGVAGWLAGLPVSAGPILFIVALEQGPAFAASAASASLSAVSSTVVFCAVYSHASLRFDWRGTLLITGGVWVIAVNLLARLPVSTELSFGLAASALLGAPYLFPAPKEVAVARSMSMAELAMRAIAGAMLTMAVSFSAATIGTAWSGLLTTYPVLGTVLAVFSHRNHGPDFVTVLLRSMATGMYSFATFFLILALLLADFGTPAAFAAAIAAGLLAQLATLRFRSVR